VSDTELECHVRRVSVAAETRVELETASAGGGLATPSQSDQMTDWRWGQLPDVTPTQEQPRNTPSTTIAAQNALEISTEVKGSIQS
jgi:hypothetical protein